MKEESELWERKPRNQSLINSGIHDLGIGRLFYLKKKWVNMINVIHIATEYR